LDLGQNHDVVQNFNDRDLFIPGNVVIENVTGTSFGDTLVGNTLVNVLIGGAGEDTMTGGAGDDTIIGGDGTDTARYTGSYTDYTITESGGTVTVIDTRTGSPDGTDTLTSIETLYFETEEQFYAAPSDAPINDHTVSTPTDANTDPNSISESASNGDLVGITASAHDDDTTNHAVTYTLTDNPAGRFAIDGTTGVVTVADATQLDSESATSHALTVKADEFRRQHVDGDVHH